MINHVDIVVCNYNYIINSNIRKSLKIKIDRRTIIIFDESHNLNNTIELENALLHLVEVELWSQRSVEVWGIK